jgi:hypothetical protein
MTIKTPPIAMTHDNFCAVLSGLKTETRRPLKVRDLTQELTNELKSFYQDGDGNWIGCSDDSPDHAEFILRKYPKGSNKGIKSKYQIGDRCYLTEPTRIVLAPDQSLYYQIEYFWHDPKTIQKLVTLEDREKIAARKKGIYKETTARFMLKSFARYWVEITDVRVERLLDITEEAAIAEGIQYVNTSHGTMYLDYTCGKFALPNPIKSYLSEIAYIHKDRGGWDFVKSNPWLWVYKFKLVTP